MQQSKGTHATSSGCLLSCLEWNANCSFTKERTNSSIDISDNKVYLITHQKSLQEKIELIQAKPRVKQQKVQMNFPIESTEQYSDKYVSLIFPCCLKEDLKHKNQYTEINNNFVHKHLFFTLNGKIHNTTLFQSDIKFEIDAKQIIKSIQFKLERYKASMFKKKEQKISQYFISTLVINKGDFFAVEFYKKFPSQKALEEFHTNFNSIVNCGIVITKFFINFQYDPVNQKIFTSRSLLRYESENKFSNSYYGKNEILSDFEYSIYDDITYNKFNSFSVKFQGNRNKRKYKDANINNNILSSPSSYSTNSTCSSGSGTFNEYLALLAVNQIKPIYHFQALSNHYDGMCNFIIFAKEACLNIDKFNISKFKKITLNEFFKSFEKISAYGCEISFLVDKNEMMNVDYTITLSSLSLSIRNKNLFDALLKRLEKKYQKSEKEKTQEFKIDECLYVSFKDSLIIEFNEKNPLHNRMLLTDKVESILNELELNDQILLSDLDSSSFFSLNWQPTHFGKNKLCYTSFLVYYQFIPEGCEMLSRGYDNYYELPLIGILPAKFDEDLWLRRIKKISFSLYGGYFNENPIEFGVALQENIHSVINFISKFNWSHRGVSTDYEFFIRNSKNKYGY